MFMYTSDITEEESSLAEFCEFAVKHNVVAIPGGVFSERDTHFRISFACQDDQLAEGLQILRGLMTTSA